MHGLGNNYRIFELYFYILAYLWQKHNLEKFSTKLEYYINKDNDDKFQNVGQAIDLAQCHES